MSVDGSSPTLFDEAAVIKNVSSPRPPAQAVSGTVPVLLKSTIYFLTALARFRAEGVVKRWGAHCVLFGWGSISGKRL